MKILLLMLLPLFAYSQNPVGGGKGYSPVYTSGDYIVRTASELEDALDSAKSGQVIFIDADSIDLSYTNNLTIKNGITLAGNRGHKGNEGALLLSWANYPALDYVPLFLITGDSVTVTGLRFRGHSGEIGNYDYQNIGVSNAIRIEGPYATITNCEIYNFDKWAIWVPYCNNTYIAHNYIHHCRRIGFGYGVWSAGTTYTGIDCVIEYNLFESLRHCVAGGSNYNSYYARNNVIMAMQSDLNFERHASLKRGGTETVIKDNLFFSHGSHYGLAYPKDSSGRTVISGNYFVLGSPAGYIDKPTDLDTSFKQVFIEDNFYNGDGRNLPVIKWDFSDTSGVAPYKVTLKARGDTSEIIRYDISFGDGNRINRKRAARISHAYKQPGEYTASIIAFNKQGIPSEPSFQKIKVVHEWRKYICSAWIKDSYHGTVAGKYFKQILLDGRPVWESDCVGDSGWQHAVVNLTPYVNNLNPVHTFQIRILAREETDKIKECRVWVDGLSISNSSMYNGDFETNDLSPPFGLAYYRINGSSEISVDTFCYDDYFEGIGGFRFRFLLSGIYHSGAYGELYFKKLIFY